MTVHVRTILRSRVGKCLAYSLLVMLPPTVGIAQERIALHLTGGGVLTTPVTAITALGGVPTPKGLLFSGATATWQPWFVIGADAELTPGNRQLRLGGRVGVSWNRFHYTAPEQVPLATDDGGTYDATIEHDLQVRFATVFVEPFLRYQIESWLAVEGGIPLHLSSASYYEQRMRFSDPVGQQFVDGSTEIAVGSGPIPRLSVLVPTLQIAAEGLIPLRRGRTLFLTPRVSAMIPLLPWESASGMRTFTAMVGVGIRYRFADGTGFDDGLRRDTIVVRDTITLLSDLVDTDTVVYAGEIVQEFPADELINVLVRYRYKRLIPKPPAVLKVALRAAFEEGDGAIIGGTNVRVHSVRRTRRVPVLPLVAFQPSEQLLPDRYVQLDHEQASTWSEEQIFCDTVIHWQYHILNVLGSRMQAMPNSTMQIVSYDDGTADGAILNAQRTTSIRSYLTQVFGVDQLRIPVTTLRGKPSEKPWVVFVDPTRRLLKPMAITDTIIEVQVPKLRITPDVVSERGIRQWVLTVTGGSDTLYVQRGDGPLPKQLFWDMSTDLDPRVVASGVPIAITLDVVDRDGNQQQSDPTRIVLGGGDQPAASMIPRRITIDRTVAIRWLGPDDLRTPDRELLGTPRDYDVVPVIRGRQREWIQAGLQEPEQSIFGNIEFYIKNERRP